MEEARGRAGTGLSAGASAALLLALSPALAELLSGSSPPLEFFSPFALLFGVLFYGCGAMLVRELSLAWGTGWPGRAALGAAFAVVEEGFMVKTFFGFGDLRGSPARDIDHTGSVYWFWIAGLVVYHAVSSILVPILLAEAVARPQARGARWTGRRGMAALWVLFAAPALLGFAAFRDDALTPLWPVLCLGALAVAAGIAAWSRTLRPRSRPPGREVRPARLFAEALGLYILYLAALFALPGILGPTALANSGAGTLVLVLVAAGGGLWARSRFGGREPDGARTVALAWGLLLPWILLAPLQEMDNARRPDDTTGMAAVGALAALLLVLWSHRAGAAGQAHAGTASDAVPPGRPGIP